MTRKRFAQLQDDYLQFVKDIEGNDDLQVKIVLFWRQYNISFYFQRFMLSAECHLTKIAHKITDCLSTGKETFLNFKR